MKYTIDNITNTNFIEFGDFINPYEKKAEEILLKVILTWQILK